ncbi:ATP/GTP-binding protein [Streptomyces microflavus]|uniref:ATP/GTP-binding protein n=1 Tax=Streptomyces microflavus TaxID=1919 RepID=UPI0033D9181A
MSDDTDSNVISLPTRGSNSGTMPDAPDAGDYFYSEPPDSSPGGAPPEPPDGFFRRIPAVRNPVSPEIALRESGMPEAPEFEEEEYEEGEYEQPRSLADRLGDWLELRLEAARDRHAGEAPFREAEIARKVALLEARTAQETGMAEQNAKFHAAQMKAKSDKAAAHGKADAARSSGSGLGADKGGRSKAGGGGSSGGSGRGGDRGPGTNGSGGSGRGSGGGNSPKGAGKGSDRSAGGGKGPSKGNKSSGGTKGRQNGSGGSGAGKAGAGKGSSGGSGGKNGSGSTGSGKSGPGKSGPGGSGTGKGGSKGDGGNSKNAPAVSPRAERSRGRQERAAARQAARQQRRSADQAANLADRSKDRDQDRAAVQAAREERRKVKAERKAKARAKREAAKAANDRTTLGTALGKEAQRRWDERRAAEKDKAAKDDKAKDDAGDTKTTGDKDSEATPKKTTKKGPEKSSDSPKGDSATKEPDGGKKRGEKPSDGSAGTGAKDGTATDTGPEADDVKDPPNTEDNDRERSFKEKIKDFFTKDGEDSTPPGPEEPSRLRPEDLGDITVDRPGGPTRTPQPEPAEDHIPDAVIVDDPSDPFGADRIRQPGLTTGTPGLPPAPERHAQRPGTSRPITQEDPVASEVNKPASGQARMAAKHRTDITFGDYLTEIVNIAITAGLDKDRAQELAIALGKVADALRDMATDLVGDHNIATEVVDQITDLADAASRMKALAERCAAECEIASEAARLAAMSVGRVYGQDMQAMDDAGLANASSAAHHD